MTIQKGQPWGTTIVVPTTTRDIDSDWQLARGTPNDVHVLSGGDMYNALGQPKEVSVGETRTLVQIDAMECTITGDFPTYVVLASASIEFGHWHRYWRSRRYVAITNGGILNGRNIAPRAHPNDAFIDMMTLRASMPMRARFMSIKRARSGTHLPHPDISVERGEIFTISRAHENEHLRIDGESVSSWSSWSSVTVKVLPDYWRVIV
jgi:hypothetical protein